MNKFSIIDIQKPKNFKDNKPSLYKVWFGNNFYVHKGKELLQSLNRFLDDVDRGIRGKQYFEYYKGVVDYCVQYPQVHKISVEVISNADPDIIMRKEATYYNNKKPPNCLNNFKLPQYKPEWAVMAVRQKRCEKCLTSGVVDGKKTKFVFCPNCGRINK